MRVNISLAKKAFGILFATLLLFSFPAAPEARAANINFSMSILPVRFVYLDKRGEIEKIWSNVTENDSLYVIKYLDGRTRKELNVSEERIFKSYQTIINEVRLVDGAVDAKRMAKNTTQSNLSVDFIKNGNILEEVRTYS